MQPAGAPLSKRPRSDAVSGVMVAALHGNSLVAAQPHETCADVVLRASRGSQWSRLQKCRPNPPPPTPPLQQLLQRQLQAQEQRPQVLRVLDLYSGIGGMHHALLRLLQPGPQAPESNQHGQPPPLAPLPEAGQGVEAAGAQPGVRLHVTAADINTLANRVYAAEFGVHPRTLDLQRVTAAQLDELAADLWVLTPPCQPYTTTSNARRRDTADPRAASLLHLLSPAVLPAMRRPPARLLLKNVPGFVGSGSHAALRGALAAAGYELQEFVVSPHQLGVPYSRPRYFALAVRRPLRFPQRYDCSRGPIEHPPALASSSSGPGHCAAPAAAAGGVAGAAWPQSHTAEGPTAWPGVYDAGPAVASDEPSHRPSGSPSAAATNTATPPNAAAAASTFTTRTCTNPLWTPRTPTLEQYLTSIAPGDALISGRAQDEPGRSHRASTSAAAGAGSGGGDSDPWVAYAVPAAQLARFWRVLDVVTPSSTYCNCFTKHYADNLLGAGSVLASEDFAARFCTRDARGRLHFAAPPPLPPSALPRRQPPPPSSSSCSAHAVTSDLTPTAYSGLALSNTAALTASASAVVAGAARPEQPPDAARGCSRDVPVVWRQRPRGGGRSAGGGGRRSGLGRGHMSGGGSGDSAEVVERKGAPGQQPPPPQQQQQEAASAGARRQGGSAADVTSAAVEPTSSAALRQQSEGANADADADAAEAGGGSEAEAVVLGLRFFAPVEVAAIHGLPAGWAARADAVGVQPRQQYGLLGNGLSTDVASYLLQYLFDAQPCVLGK